MFYYYCLVFDSTAKVPDGVLMGNLFEMGNYDECVEIEGIESIFGEFRGQYCVLDIIPSQKLLTKLMEGVFKNTPGDDVMSAGSSMVSIILFVVNTLVNVLLNFNKMYLLIVVNI